MQQLLRFPYVHRYYNVSTNIVIVIRGRALLKLRGDLSLLPTFRSQQLEDQEIPFTLSQNLQLYFSLTKNVFGLLGMDIQKKKNIHPCCSRYEEFRRMHHSELWLWLAVRTGLVDYSEVEGSCQDPLSHSR